MGQVSSIPTRICREFGYCLHAHIMCGLLQSKTRVFAIHGLGIICVFVRFEFRQGCRACDLLLLFGLVGLNELGK
jgi:hypothetical protein